MFCKPPLGGGAFSPEDIADLVLWAEADMTGSDLVLSGSKVTTWGKAAYAQLTQGTDAKRPTFVADAGDGLPELTWDGSDDFMESASLSYTRDLTIYLIGGYTGANRQLYWYGNATVYDWLFGTSSGNVMWRIEETGAANQTYIRTTVAPAAFIRAACESTTPFGFPVVPEV